MLITPVLSAPAARTHYLYCQTGKMIMQGFFRDGFFQEYIGVDYRTAIVLPEGMDPAEQGSTVLWWHKQVQSPAIRGPAQANTTGDLYSIQWRSQSWIE